eukprot:11173806-Lingulodinium_polyedra.AAC.1
MVEDAGVRCYRWAQAAAKIVMVLSGRFGRAAGGCQAEGERGQRPAWLLQLPCSEPGKRAERPAWLLQLPCSEAGGPNCRVAPHQTPQDKRAAGVAGAGRRPGVGGVGRRLGRPVVVP